VSWIRTVSSLRSVLFLVGIVTLLLFMQNHTAAQDIVDDECLDFACDVEGISAILASTDDVEIDTYGETDISFDLLDAGFEADVVGNVVEDDINNVIDSQEGFDDGSGSAFVSMSDPVEIGHDYGSASDHYVIDDFSGESDFVGSTIATVLTFAPEITAIDPPFGDVNTSGQLVIDGSFLLDQFDFSVTFSLIPGVSFTGGEASPDGTEVILDYTIDPSAPTGDQEFFIETRFGQSNIVTFRINDPTPIVNSVTPNQWDAGTQTSITVTGQFFGTCPALDISGPGVTGSSVTSFSDTQIQGTVTIDPASAGGTATVNVTSDGYTCSGFLGNPGQPKKASNTAQIKPKPAPAPQITFFGTPLNGTQAVVVGQRIELSSTATTVAPLAVTSTTWSAPSPGVAIASFSGSAASGEVPTQLLNFSNPSLIFYLLSTGGGASANNSLTFSYCMVNSQCSAPVTANFTVTAPSNVAPTITPTSMNTFHANGKDLLAYQTLSPGARPGITFKAPGQANLPANQGQYQWVQLLNQDNLIYMGKLGLGTCTFFSSTIDPAPELDTAYPYGSTIPNTVITSQGGVTNDTAMDSPALTLNVNTGEMERAFIATMNLRWIPDQDPVCTAGTACTIPVPLGSANWRISGCDIDTLTPQTNGTNWNQSCPAFGAPPQNVVYQPVTPSQGNNYGYATWSNIAPGQNCHIPVL
jgi:hypothetical protein